MTVVAMAAPSAPPVVTPAGLARVRFRAMGTQVEVLLPAEREAAARIVVSVFATWEARCSRFDPTSELSRLNAAAGAPVIVSRPLFETIATALEAARATDGIFDPTVLHRLASLGYDRTFDAIAPDGPCVPDVAPDMAVHGAPAWSGAWTGAWDRVRLDRPTRSVQMPAGVGIDLGGIAKGMAVDASLAALAAAGVDHAAVNAGGDLAVLGEPPGATAWWVGVETADGGEVVALERGALATSSVANRRWVRGGRVMHHIVDPRTGLPAASGLVSVSVSAGACAQAEVAAKTALMLGLADGTTFLTTRGLSALAVDDDGRRHRIGRWVDPAAMIRADGPSALPHRDAGIGGHRRA